MGANIVGGQGTNMPESKRDKFEALLKALMVFSLIFFGIFAFGHVFPDQCKDIASDKWMFVSLLITLGAGITLCTINTLFPHRQETKREKAPVTDLKENFTHIIALIITIPLIVVTCILLIGGNHSEELTFISGLLGVILGYYFGQRGVESAENKGNLAMIEKKASDIKSTKAVKDLKKERQEMAYSIQKNTMDANKESLYPLKEIAWVQFKEKIKEDFKEKNKDFKEVENIDKYPPWKEPESRWNKAEKMLITQFEEEWGLLGGEEAASLGDEN